MIGKQKILVDQRQKKPTPATEDGWKMDDGEGRKPFKEQK